MPLTRFEECWPLPKKSLPELPYNLNIVTLTLTLWPINCGVLTSLLLPHLSSSLTDSLPSLNLLCHSKTHARFMQYAPKAVWSIPYVSVAFFPSLKHDFIAYRSSKVSDCIFKIHQLWQSDFSRMYFNCCCSCSFKPEIIKIDQSSRKMYSYKILNFQVSTTILNAHTKKSGNLSYAPRSLEFDWGKCPKSYPEKRPVCRRFSTDALKERLEAAGCRNRHLLDFHQTYIYIYIYIYKLGDP